MKKLTDPKQVPKNMTEEEEAHFWHTHSMTKEFLNKLECVPKDKLTYRRREDDS